MKIRTFFVLHAKNIYEILTHLGIFARNHGENWQNTSMKVGHVNWSNY